MIEEVTRVEIAEAVRAAFGNRGADRSDVLAAATSLARPEVIAHLSTLPERRYGKINDLWVDLGHLPVGV
ncbi:hypothetical protein BH23ACT5_BH23ACT5_16340 [soil metagenome]